MTLGELKDKLEACDLPDDTPVVLEAESGCYYVKASGHYEAWANRLAKPDRGMDYDRSDEVERRPGDFQVVVIA